MATAVSDLRDREDNVFLQPSRQRWRRLSLRGSFTRRKGCDYFRLPIAVGGRRVISPSDLITFAMYHENHANGAESGRKDEEQNYAFQRFNHSRAGRSHLSA